MNQREPTTAPKGAGQALPCLALLLLPLLMAQRAWSRPVRPVGNVGHESAPYLSSIGAPLLRFADATPPPDVVGRPAAGAPPHPESVEDISEPAASAASAKKKMVVSTSIAPANVMIESTTDAGPETAKKPVAGNGEAPVPETHAPAPILQDELHPQARPEDFLPFFQIPSAHPGDTTNTVPVPRTPAPLPQSSATYTQTPK